MRLPDASARGMGGAPREGAASVKIDDKTYPVKSTPRRGLKQVDFVLADRTCAGLNKILIPNHDGQQWREIGKKVMQFLDGGRYRAVVSDGKLQLYKKSE